MPKKGMSLNEFAQLVQNVAMKNPRRAWSKGNNNKKRYTKVSDDQTNKNKLSVWQSFYDFLLQFILCTLLIKRASFTLSPSHEIIIKFTTRINLIGTWHLWKVETTSKMTPINFFMTLWQKLCFFIMKIKSNSKGLYSINSLIADN